MEGRRRSGQREGVDLELHQLETRHADLRIHDERRRRNLIASLAEVGQQVPVVVIGDGERMVLIDGYLRVDALRRLKRDTVAATAWSLPEAEALLHHHHMAGSRRSALEEAWLLSRLREQGLTLEDLARRLCRSKSWVSRRLALLNELGPKAQERVRRGTIPPHAAMKYLVPLARANRRQCEQLVEALGDQRVSDREVAALYDGWRSADPTGKQRLVEAPALYLKAVQQSAAQPDEGHALLKDLTLLSSVAWRTRQRLKRDGAVAVEYARLDVGAAWRAAEGAFMALVNTWKETVPDAGSKRANDDSQTA